MPGFPGGLAGKESTCNAGDLSSISLGWEGLEKGMATHSSILAWRIPWTISKSHSSSKFQSHFWTSLVAQTVKHLSTMLETRVQSLGREDPLEKEMAMHSSTIA